MVEVGAAAFEFGDDGLGQHLAELHTPLIEAVDAPHDALGERAMFVQCDKLAEYERRESLRHHHRRRAIAREGLVGDELGGHPVGGDLLG